MSFDLKINHLCPHVQTEEIHVCEFDGKRVILNDIMASTNPESLRVKVNGVKWNRDNVLESPVVFDITEDLEKLSAFQMVLPEVPALKGDQQGKFADSDQHVIVRACTREKVPLEQLLERPRVFRLGQNQSAKPFFAAQGTAHVWGLIRPRLAAATTTVAERDDILSRYDTNPDISSADLLKNPDIIRPELERILAPRVDLQGWARQGILERFEADPTLSTNALLDGFDIPSDINSNIRALIGDGREDAVFDVSDSVREDVEVSLGDIRPQLARTLDADPSVTTAQGLAIMARFDSNPSISAQSLLTGFAVSVATSEKVSALLEDGRQPATRWAEIPVTPRLPLLGRFDFIEGEIDTQDITAIVNGEQVEVEDVDGFEGTVTLSSAPYPCDLVEFEFCWKLKLLFVNGESGVIAVDPHHLGATSTEGHVITNADVSYPAPVKDGWTLSPTAGSVGGQLDIVFDTTKRTDKGRAILEDISRLANGFNTVFQTRSAPLLPFNADFFSDPSETLFNSAPVSVNGKIVAPAAFDPVLGLVQLDSPPAPGQDVRVSYFFRMSADSAQNVAVVLGGAPANPFEPDIIEVDYITERVNCHRCNAMGRLDDIHFSRVDGSIVTVAAEQKLKQDLYKIVGTIVGSNPFHRFYGTNFIIYIGQSGPPGFFRAQLTNEMIAAVGALQRLQNDQFVYQAQFIDRRELINAVQSINVRQVDETDPSIFQVDVLLLSDAANSVDARVLLTEEGVTLLDRHVAGVTGNELTAIPQ